MKDIIFKHFLILSFLIAAGLPSKAQYAFNNSVSQYFRDGYLWNPALAGQEGTRVYGLFSSSWTGFEDASKLIGISGDVDFKNNMGAGLRLNTFSGSILRQYDAALSYSYNLKFNEQSNLRLGGELSFYKGHLDSKYIGSGGMVDPVAVAYNDRAGKVSGNAGAYYTWKNLSVGVTGYNLDTYFKDTKQEDAVELEKGMFLVNYGFVFPEDKIELQPLVAYKIFSDLENVFMGGAQFQYNKIFHFSAIMQSNGSFSGGVGVVLNKRFEVNFFYSGKAKHSLRDQYEAGLKYVNQ